MAKSGRRVAVFVNPGFNPAYLVSQVPAIVEEIVTFTKVLRDHYGQGQVFQLDTVTLNMTLDVDF